MRNSRVTLDEVLDNLMLEESTPSHAALLRWTERYPQYRDELARFFATWAMQASLPDELEAAVADEDAFQMDALFHGIKTLMLQSRVFRRNRKIELQATEQFILIATYLLRERADVAAIFDKVNEMAGSKGAVITFGKALYNLENLGLVSRRYSDPKTEPRGKSLPHYVVTYDGERVLGHAGALEKIIPEGLKDFA